MNSQTQKLLEQLASKLGTTTEYLWTVLLKQAFVDGIFNLVLSTICIIVLIVFYKLCKWLEKPDKDGDKNKDNFDAPEMFYIIGGVISTFAVVFAFVGLYEASVCFFNPEYFALKEVLSVFK